jgi:hypothetical protein
MTCLAAYTVYTHAALDLLVDIVQNILRLLPLPAEVAGKQSEHSRTVSHLDQLHNAYQECLGLRLISEEGEQQQHASLLLLCSR